MQTEDKARIARLEQLLDERLRENVQLRDDLQQQIAELQHENAELRRAVRHVINNTVDLLNGIKREVENEENRLEKILGRPVSTGSKLVDELTKEREAAS